MNYLIKNHQSGENNKPSPASGKASQWIGVFLRNLCNLIGKKNPEKILTDQLITKASDIQNLDTWVF